jgi:hypothetical protein
MDAAGKEVFESTRLGLNYDKVVANVERLIQIRDEAGKRRPKLILSFVRQNNSTEEQAFIAHWRAKADKIHINDLHNWAGTLNQESDVRFPCYRPWLTFTILWDGRVSLCCADFDGREVLGDLRTSTIKEIWNGPAYRQVRRAHLDHGGPSICQSCDRRRTRRSGSRSWYKPKQRPCARLNAPPRFPLPAPRSGDCYGSPAAGPTMGCEITPTGWAIGPESGHTLSLSVTSASWPCRQPSPASSRPVGSTVLRRPVLDAGDRNRPAAFTGGCVNGSRIAEA